MCRLIIRALGEEQTREAMDEELSGSWTRIVIETSPYHSPLIHRDMPIRTKCYCIYSKARCWQCVIDIGLDIG